MIVTIISVPRLQAVIYVTRSLMPAENEKIVQKAIESYNDAENRRHPYRIAPPVFKLDNTMAESRRSDKYYRQPPTEQANGCFVAMVTKEVRVIFYLLNSVG